MIAYCRHLRNRVIGKFGLRIQLVILLVVVQVSAHFLTFTTFAWIIDLEERRIRVAVDLTDKLLSVLSVIEPADVSTDPTILDRLVADSPGFEVLPALPGSTSEPLVQIEQQMLLSTSAPWRDRLVVYPLEGSTNWPGPPMQPFGVAVQLSADQWLNFVPNPGVFARTIPYFLLTLVVTAIAVSLTFLSIWAGSSLSAPIERLASGVDAFSKDIKSPPILEEGPREVRRATAAFNRMQRRLRKLMDDRAQTLAAIGHDMRTPLTRLRLRLEGVDAGDATEAVDADLSALERMIDDALRFMRAEGQQVDLGRADLAILCRTVCDEWADQGDQVTYEGPQNLATVCDTELMVRVLNNVIGNAVTHAGDGHLSLGQTDDGLIDITVTDTGPGIAKALYPTVLEPFSRLKSVEAGGPGTVKGFGLGLAISHELMIRQGGVLRLAPNVPKGLKVSIQLPRRDDVAA